MTRDQIVSSTKTIYALSDQDDAAIVAQLVKDGLSASDAEFASAFIPMAYARALIESMPACGSLKLADFVEVPGESDAPETLHLACVSHYSAAFALAHETPGDSGIERSVLLKVALRSAEMHVINRALNENRSLVGATMAPTLMLRIGDLLKEQRRAGSRKKKSWWRFQ